MLRLSPPREMLDTSRNGRPKRPPPKEANELTNHLNTTGITIRRLVADDDAAVERLAQLDSQARPTGHLLGAEIEGRLLVATSIETGASVADPFSKTEELSGLVSMRIAQLKGQSGSRRLRRRLRSRGALAGSPPGAGGKLLTLPVRLS